MKAERINQDQVRFTLSESDLQERNLNISELSYGSEEAKALFEDMMKTALDQFGVDFSQKPLMIEAVPLSPGSLSITVTKVKGTAEMGELFGANIPDGQDWFRGPRKSEEIHRDRGVKEADKPQDAGKDWMKDLTQVEDVIYAFRSFEALMEAAAAAPEGLRLKNELYLDESRHIYYIIVHYKRLTPQMRYMVPMLTQFAAEWFFGNAAELLVKEHGRLLIKERALQKLAATTR